MKTRSVFLFPLLSLGSFVASCLAADVILESAPASASPLLPDSGLINLSGSYVVDSDFDDGGRAACIGCALLMMHGRLDDVAPFDWHAPFIWDEANEPEESLCVEDANHSDIPKVLGNHYDAKIIYFISNHVSD